MCRIEWVEFNLFEKLLMICRKISLSLRFCELATVYLIQIFCNNNAAYCYFFLFFLFLYFFALLWCILLMLNKNLVKISWWTNPVLQWEISGSITLYIVRAKQGILNVHLDVSKTSFWFAAPNYIAAICPNVSIYLLICKVTRYTWFDLFYWFLNSFSYSHICPAKLPCWEMVAEQYFLKC